MNGSAIRHRVLDDSCHLRRETRTGGLASARAWFPVVGLLLGAIPRAATDLLMRYADTTSFRSDSRRVSLPPLLSGCHPNLSYWSLSRARCTWTGSWTAATRCSAVLTEGTAHGDSTRPARVGAFAVAGAARADSAQGRGHHVAACRSSRICGLILIVSMPVAMGRRPGDASVPIREERRHRSAVPE